MLHRFTQYVVMLWRQWDHGQADAGFNQSHFLQDPLNRYRVGFDEQFLVQREQPCVQVSRFRNIAAQGCGTHIVHELGSNIGGHRNYPLAAKEQ